MCGIAGHFCLSADTQYQHGKIVELMVEKLAHRGPDSNGIKEFRLGAFGSARLSIVDVVGGAQPLSNEDGSVWVVLNGEIYNHRELRRALESCGHRFSTSSDTEVIVHLYEEHPTNWMKLLNGMFAVAIYDTRLDRLTIARDRYGIKPLFYAFKDGQLAFSSEIKSLLSLGMVSPSLDFEALGIFLSLMFIPDPWTIFRDIRRLPPGHLITYHNRQITLEKYWDFDFGRSEPICEEEAVREISRLLRSSVRSQLPSEVKAGLLLSGGVDSTAVSTFAAKEGARLPTFTISFAEKEFDESSISSSIAACLDLKNHRVVVTEEDLSQAYLGRQRHLDEPYGLWCNVASAQLAHVMRSLGYKVALGGDGADELFFGYPTIQAALISRWYRILPQSLRRLIRSSLGLLPAGRGRLPIAFKARSFAEADDPDLIRNFFGFKMVLGRRHWSQYLTENLQKLLSDVDPTVAFSQYSDRLGNWDVVDVLGYLDLKVFMPGCVFYGIDNAFMEASVELRVPFLDNDLVDYVTKLPTATRFNMMQSKPLLKKVILDAFPERSRPVLSRTFSKRGFEVPGEAWLRTHGRFLDLVHEVMAPSRIRKHGIFRPDGVESAVANQISGRANNERLLQVMMSLSSFFEARGISL